MTLARTVWYGAFAGVVLCACSAPPPPTLVPAPDLLETSGTLFLVGDAGGAQPGDPVLVALTDMAKARPEQSTIIFLGDNIYPKGMPDSVAQDRSEAEHRLQNQIDVATRSGARAYLVPGNHDWEQGGVDGWAAVQRQAEYVRRQGNPRVVFSPEGGCPGPAAFDAPGRFVLIPLDTQWWLHPHARPTGTGEPCLTADSAAFASALRGLLEQPDDRVVVMLSHHSYRTHGIHGGHFTWKEHIFPLRELKPWLWLPLPIIGSAYPIARMNGISDQDVSGGKYRSLLATLADALAADPPDVYAGGHDHNLQVLTDSLVPTVVVSGAGYYKHLDPVGRGPDTRFAASNSGFVRIDRMQDGRVRLGVIAVDDQGPHEIYSEWIKQSVRREE